MNEWKQEGPSRDLTVYIPRISPAQPPQEKPLLPRWVGSVFMALVWLSIIFAGSAMLYIGYRILTD